MTKQGFHSKSFNQGIEILADEIKLAIQWQRPSILLAVHPSKLGQGKAQQALKKEIIESNKKVMLIKASSKTPDLISILCKTPNHDELVFFVSGLGDAEVSSKGQIYNALNLHRELLVEQHIRVVFWLTKLEAAKLPNHAPDFWAFRHRVVEFAASRGTNKSTSDG